MYRVGLGTDSHSFDDKKPLYLGGIRIDFPKGLAGHSDGDVVLHAITDAILGAIGDRDIGEIFSDKDDRWKGERSSTFLREALRRMKEKGYEVCNIDCVIIADEPKISPYKDRIKESIGNIMGIDPSLISLKGKRPEGIVVEGIMCQCVVLLRTCSNEG